MTPWTRISFLATSAAKPTVLVHNLTLVTHNVHDFAHLPGLRIEIGCRPEAKRISRFPRRNFLYPFPSTEHIMVE
jgi:hypothetical protein